MYVVTQKSVKISDTRVGCCHLHFTTTMSSVLSALLFHVCKIKPIWKSRTWQELDKIHEDMQRFPDLFFCVGKIGKV